MKSLLRFSYWVGGLVGGPALTVERCLCRRTRRRPERQHPQATRLLIMLNLLSRFNKAWRLTSVRHFIVYPSRKVCSSSGLNVEIDWRPKVSIILYRNINISHNTTQSEYLHLLVWFYCRVEKGGKTYKESPSVSDPVAINFLKKLVRNSYLTWNMITWIVHA